MTNRPPGLDEAVSDEQLAAFTAGRSPVLEEPPPRRWPLVLLAGVLGVTLGWIAGVTAGPYITWLEALLIAVLVLASTATIVLIERHDELHR